MCRREETHTRRVVKVRTSYAISSGELGSRDGLYGQVLQTYEILPRVRHCGLDDPKYNNELGLRLR
jgi:hypothetical protein